MFYINCLILLNNFILFLNKTLWNDEYCVLLYYPHTFMSSQLGVDKHRVTHTGLGPWAEIYELITGPLFSSSCSAALLLDLENNEELNLKVSIIPAAVWLLVAGHSAVKETSIVNNIPFDDR